MSNITVNITGDVNIILPSEATPDISDILGIVQMIGEDGTPNESFLIDPCCSEDDACDESDMLVLYIIPGGKGVIMPLLEALEKMQEFGGCNRVRYVPTYDLHMAYNDSSVVSIGKGKYLIAPAIVYTSFSGDVMHINREDAQMARRIMEERTVQLSDGRNTVSAFTL